MGGLQEDVERWMTHEGFRFERMESPGNTFQILARHAGTSGIPIEFFEPGGQPGVLVVGAHAVMRNHQIARYVRFSEAERERFRARVREFCDSIRAVSRFIDEDGKPKIGVYVVLDGGNIVQPEVFEAIERVSEMREQVVKFLMRTF